MEIFVAPEAPTKYFEVEINPLGTVFDAVWRVDDGVEDRSERIDFDLEVLRERLQRDEDLNNIFLPQRLVMLEITGDNDIIITNEEDVQTLHVPPERGCRN